MKTQLQDHTTTYRPLDTVDSPSTAYVRTNPVAEPKTPRRTPHWKAGVAALAIAGAALGAVAIVNDAVEAVPEPTVEPASPWLLGTGPGSNSLNIAPISDTSPRD